MGKLLCLRFNMAKCTDLLSNLLPPNSCQVSGLEEHMILIVKKPRTAPYAHEPCQQINHILSTPLSYMHKDLKTFVRCANFVMLAPRNRPDVKRLPLDMLIVHEQRFAVKL